MSDIGKNPNELLPNNSDVVRSKRQRETEKTRETGKQKVTKGNVKKKKNNVKSFVNNFVSKDMDDIKSHIFHDVVIPLIKDGISDVVSMALYGDTGRRRRGRSSSSRDRESYRSYYEDRRSSRDRDKGYSRTANRFDCEDLIFDYRDDAEAVIDKMLETLDEYPIVTVLDMYEFAGETPPYTAKRYGWTDLDGIQVVKAGRDGWMIKVRRPMPID